MISNDLAKIVSDIRPYSMVPDEGVALTIDAAISVIDRKLKGDLVECGVWRGGCSFAMLLAQRARYGKVIKPVWMFDSFEGLPPVNEKDGPAAARYQANPNAADYMDNCKAPLDGVLEAIKTFGFSSTECIVVPGWFNSTFNERLPELAPRGVALLRVDCDWYDPVKFTLDQMGQLVTENGIVILDDYYTWDGCARATHDYLSQNDLPYRIRCLPSGIAAWMVKQTNGREPPNQ